MLGKSKEPIITEPKTLKQAEIKDTSRFLGDTNLKTDEIKFDAALFKSEKNELQKELESFKNPEVYEVPEFLTDEDKSLERKQVIERLQYLLKRKFSLITIADILETNDYNIDKINDIIDRKEKLYLAVEKYTKEDKDEEEKDEQEEPETKKQGVRLFSGFKKTVGYDYALTYSEEERKTESALKILYDGSYFKDAEEEKEDVGTYVEDIVAKLIDSPEFNLACQIEAEFVNFEMTRVSTILNDLGSKKELQELVDELRKESQIMSNREHAYQVMDKLISGKERKIISENNDEIPVGKEATGEGER